MGKQYQLIPKKSQEFIANQKLFFVATATKDSRVNLSPKGGDSLRVLSENRVVWLNLTGSGNETAAHLLENDRMTLMFCAFEGKPMILRLYGTAKIYHPRDKEYTELIDLFPDEIGARQIIDMTVDLVQTSCGMAVPFYNFVEERNQLKNWTEKKGKKEIGEYWKDRNLKSIDGKPTGI
ncbi:MAG: pyridoxamine 5'-phosphate oxidase family protein [Flavobacteriaceae bacterium]|nr:pyridoxamine 5'-phosphate oxidase family protein [Flavobacteriaceae bacterium]